MEKLPLVVLLLESMLFALVERNLWRTWITPLNCLMIPYVLVVLICVLVDGSMGFVPFYIPSLWVWIVGLLFFFLPSFLLSILYNAGTSRNRSNPKDFLFSWEVPYLEKVTEAISILFFAWFLIVYFTSGLRLGSDDFGTKLAGSGFFGHLFTLYMFLTIVWILLLDRNHKKYILYIGMFFFIAILYMVKGWLLIPLIGGFLLRILTMRLKLKARLMFGVLVFGFVFFFMSYWLTMFIARADTAAAYYGMTRKEYAISTANYIQRHFVTYLTAGVYGLSETMAQGKLEEEDPSKVFTALFNIKNFFSGDEMVSPVNEYYLHTTVYDGGVNVRTFMGTIYLFLGPWHGILYVLIFSIIVHILFFIVRQRENIFVLAGMGWIIGNLFMGWFEFYMQHLNFITVPLFALCLYALIIYFHLKRDTNKSLMLNSLR